jgi:inosose dehydratase
MSLPIQVAQTPDSWGIEEPDDPSIASWETFLDQVAASGYAGVELGPLGFLPKRAAALADELQSRALELVAGYVMEPWSDPARADDIIRTARDTCELLSQAGARYVVLIDALGERADVAGQADAPRLEASRRRIFLHRLRQVATLAREDFALVPVFHPHAGTYVEFEDEIAWLADSTDPSLIGLCIDTGHCVFSGLDPVKLCEAYADRLRYLHLKDVDPSRLRSVLDARGNFAAAVSAGVFCRLGEGAVEFAALADVLRATGYVGWAGVEQDRLPKAPDDRLPFEDALASARFLEGMGFHLRARA